MRFGSKNPPFHANNEIFCAKFDLLQPFLRTNSGCCFRDITLFHRGPIALKFRRVRGQEQAPTKTKKTTDKSQSLIELNREVRSGFEPL